MTDRKRTTKRGMLKLVIIGAAAAVMMAACTSCSPALKLKAKYAYTDLRVEYGTPVSTDVDEYADLSGLSEKDKEYVRKNTAIEYNGVKEPGSDHDAPGEYKLTISYKGQHYRTYNVKVTDSKPPVFTKASDMTIIAGMSKSTLARFSNSPDYGSMFAAEDNSPGMKLDVDHSQVNEDHPGTYTVTATATDISGNATHAKAKVHVLKPGYGLNTTYVYVSIGDQYLTYFKDGKVALSCPVVTGNVAEGHSTPVGVFMVNWKCMNITLKGEDYESPVTYWMPFIGGQIGFHDAPWRGAFGGSIYRYSGSHGCINMPVSYAARLYSMLEVRTPVVIEA